MLPRRSTKETNFLDIVVSKRSSYFSICAPQDHECLAKSIDSFIRYWYIATSNKFRCPFVTDYNIVT